jgi:hypothetical protein
MRPAHGQLTRPRRRTPRGGERHERSPGGVGVDGEYSGLAVVRLLPTIAADDLESLGGIGHLGRPRGCRPRGMSVSKVAASSPMTSNADRQAARFCGSVMPSVSRLYSTRRVSIRE